MNYLKKCIKKITGRNPLVNEFRIDIKDKTPQQVAAEATALIDTAKTQVDYDYVKPDKNAFYSWVFSNGLR